MGDYRSYADIAVLFKSRAVSVDKECDVHGCILRKPNLWKSDLPPNGTVVISYYIKRLLEKSDSVGFL